MFLLVCIFQKLCQQVYRSRFIVSRHLKTVATVIYCKPATVIQNLLKMYFNVHSSRLQVQCHLRPLKDRLITYTGAAGQVVIYLMLHRGGIKIKILKKISGFPDRPLLNSAAGKKSSLKSEGFRPDIDIITHRVLDLYIQI